MPRRSARVAPHSRIGRDELLNPEEEPRRRMGDEFWMRRRSHRRTMGMSFGCGGGATVDHWGDQFLDAEASARVAPRRTLGATSLDAEEERASRVAVEDRAGVEDRRDEVLEAEEERTSRRCPTIGWRKLWI